MAYVSLYRKYRPRTFDEVVGQTHVIRTLVNAIEEDRLHHAYLFTGPRGTGKTSTARLLAKAINCEQGPTPTPCDACGSCEDISNGTAVDVIELDMASHGGVEDARELRDRALFAPARSRRKVYILDEVHMASTAAFNALLKLIEEPPPHVLFAMATTDPQKVLPTIMSRVQRLDLRRVSAAEVAGNVRRLCEAEGYTIEDDAVDAVVRAGDGSVRDTQSILEQVLAFAGTEVTGAAVAQVLGHTPADRVVETVDRLAARDLAGLFAVVQGLLDEGHDLRRFTLDLVQQLRDLLVLQVAPDRPDLVDATDDRRRRLQAQTAALPRAALLRAVDELAACLVEQRQGPPRLPLELTLARLAVPGADSDLAELADRIGRLERTGIVATAADAAAATGTGGPTRPGGGTAPGRGQGVGTAAPAEAAPTGAAEAPDAAEPRVPMDPAAPVDAPAAAEPRVQVDVPAAAEPAGAADAPGGATSRDTSAGASGPAAGSTDEAPAGSAAAAPPDDDPRARARAAAAAAGRRSPAPRRPSGDDAGGRRSGDGDAAEPRSGDRPGGQAAASAREASAASDPATPGPDRGDPDAADRGAPEAADGAATGATAAGAAAADDEATAAPDRVAGSAATGSEAGGEAAGGGAGSGSGSSPATSGSGTSADDAGSGPPTPDAAGATAAAEATTSVSEGGDGSAQGADELERVLAHWAAILELVKQRSRRCHALFEPATPAAVARNILTLRYARRYASFHAANATKGEFSDVLTGAIEQACGLRLRLDVVIEGQDDRRRPVPASVTPDDARTAVLDDHPSDPVAASEEAEVREAELGGDRAADTDVDELLASELGAELLEEHPPPDPSR